VILPWGLESRRFLVLAFSCSCPAALWDRPGLDHGRHTHSILCQGSADPPPVLLSQNQEAIGMTGRVDFTPDFAVCQRSSTTSLLRIGNESAEANILYVENRQAAKQTGETSEWGH